MISLANFFFFLKIRKETVVQAVDTNCRMEQNPDDRGNG